MARAAVAAAALVLVAAPAASAGDRMAIAVWLQDGRLMAAVR